MTVDGLRAVKPMSEWQLSDNAAYLHYCPNETIDGIAIHEEPDFGENVIVTADLSSTILSTRWMSAATASSTRVPRKHRSCGSDYRYCA